MRIGWDEVKRQRNLQEHGLNFADVDAHFDLLDALIVSTYPGSDSRPRFIAIGPLFGGFASLVFARLGMEAISAISLRPSSRKERRAYAERHTTI